MSDWMTIRVILSGQAGHALAQPPGRVLLAHADHTLAELAEAIDTAFGRWDLTPLHAFELDGRTYLSSEAVEGHLEEGEASVDVSIGEVGLRTGVRFTYAFDLGEGWTHDCSVETIGEDLDDLDGDEPDRPVPVYGWGTIPDQYGVLVEDGGGGDRPAAAEFLSDGATGEADDEEDEEEDEDDSWQAAASASWSVVARALASVDRERDDDALALVTSSLRARAAADAEDDEDEIGADVLFDAADLDRDDPPADDEELWTQLAAAVVDPDGEVELDDDLLSAWTSLEPADWAGAVIELIRSGTGTPASPDALIELVERCPEVEGEELTEDDEAVLLEGLEVVVALWRVLGALDADDTLTPLGLWGLPRALERAWTGA